MIVVATLFVWLLLAFFLTLKATVLMLLLEILRSALDMTYTAGSWRGWGWERTREGKMTGGVERQGEREIVE